MAKEYRSRPSELVGIHDDPYTAFCLDEAVTMFATHVENELRRVSENTKQSPKTAANRRRMVLMNLLKDDLPPLTREGWAQMPQSTKPTGKFSEGVITDEEAAAKGFPAPVRFGNRSYRDPAELFKKNKQ